MSFLRPSLRTLPRLLPPARPAFRPLRASVLPKTRIQFYNPRSPRDHHRRPPNIDYDAPPPPPRDPEKAGRSIMAIFFLIATPVSICFAFPNTFIPPTPLSPSLAQYRNKPLTPQILFSQPLDAAQVFWHRLRRGVYYQTLVDNFTVIPANVVGAQKDQPPRWHTLLMNSFAHGSAVHFVCCSVALTSLVPMMCVRFGTAKSAVFLLGSAVGSSWVGSQWLYYRVGAGKMTGLEIQEAAERGDRAAMSFVSSTLGSSGALMAAFAACAIAVPKASWGIILVPINIPARVLWGMLLAFDLGGAAGLFNLGIAHEGHLGGDVMGVLLYLLLLRRGRFMSRRVKAPSRQERAARGRR